MGTVYLVRDLRHHGALRALKQVRSGPSSEQNTVTLRNEFLALSRLHHPNLMRVHDFGVDRRCESAFFTCEFLEGVSWLAAQKKWAKAGQFENLVATTIHVLRALEFVHSCGFVHSDMKPDNVVICTATEGASAVVAKLIDFGLAKRERQSSGKKILGTPYYVAPETILGYPVDRRSDLYSLGVVLYQLVTGSPPFVGEDNLTILKSHVEHPAPDPCLKNAAVPSVFGGIIRRLLAKKADDRFQSAAEVVEAINAAGLDDASLETEETVKAYLRRGWLGGRESELRFLLEVTREAVTPKNDTEASASKGRSNPFRRRTPKAPGNVSVPAGRCVLVRARHGSGSRQLLDRVRAAVQIDGVTVVDVQCGGGAEDGIDDLRRLLDGVVECDADSVISSAKAAARVVGAIGEVDRDTSKVQLREALSVLASAVFAASSERPIVLFLRDLSAASLPIVWVLRALLHLAASGDGNVHFLLVATLSDHIDSQGEAFSQLALDREFRRSVAEMKVSALSREGVDRAIRSVFGNLKHDAAFLSAVHEESDGDIRVVIRILSVLFQQGRIIRRARGWSLSEDFDVVAIPGKVRSELRQKLRRLPETARNVAAALACMRTTYDLPVASEAAGLDAEESQSILATLLEAGILNIVEEGGSGTQYAFAHNGAKSLLYGSIASDRRGEVHERLGRLFERFGKERHSLDYRELAHHYLRARNRRKAIEYAIEAARDYAREHRFVDAVATYEKILGLLTDDDQAPRFLVRREMAALKLVAGDYQRAASLFGECVAEGRGEGRDLFDPGHVLAAEIGLARAATTLGDVDTAVATLKHLSTLELDAGLQARVEIERAVLWLSQDRFVEALRCCREALGLLTAEEHPMLCSEALSLSAESLCGLNDRQSAEDCCQHALRLIEGLRDERNWAQSAYIRSRLYFFRRRYPESLEQLDLALSLWRELRAYDRQAECLAHIGEMLCVMGQSNEAEARLKKSRAVFRRTRNRRATLHALTSLGEAKRSLGKHREARRVLSDAIDLARKLGCAEGVRRAEVAMAETYLDVGRFSAMSRHLHDSSGGEDSRTQNGLRRCHLSSIAARQMGEMEPAIRSAERGLQIAREVSEPLSEAMFLHEAALCRYVLGQRRQAGKHVASLLRLGESYGFDRWSGNGRIVEALLHEADDRPEAADSSYAYATEDLRRSGDEKSLCRLYLEFGVFCLRRGDFEQAYLNIQEGSYLAEKLQSRFLMCRFLWATAHMNRSVAGAPSDESMEQLRRTHKQATEVGFSELAWRIECDLGLWLNERGESDQAVVSFNQALTAAEEVVRKLPPAWRHTYLHGAHGSELREALNVLPSLKGRAPTVGSVLGLAE